VNQRIHGSSFLFPRYVDFAIRGFGRGEEPSGANVLRLIRIRLSDAESGKISLGCQAAKAATANRRFQFYKRSQLFIRVHNETLSVAAMSVCDPDCSPFAIQG